MASSDVWYACYEINAIATHSLNTWLCQGPYESLSIVDKCSETRATSGSANATMNASRKVALSAPNYMPRALQEVLISKSLQRLLRPEIGFHREPPASKQPLTANDWNSH